MVIFKLKELLEKHHMSRYKLRQYTGLTYTRVNDYYFGRVKDIKVSEINLLCKLFDCKIIGHHIEDIHSDYVALLTSIIGQKWRC